MIDKVDNDRFEEIMRGLAENFNAQITKHGLRFRFEALRSFTIDQVECAAMSLVGTRKYTTMPTIAEFLEYIQGGSADDVAEVEARKVWGAITRHGATNNVVFDDPVTMATVERGFGGWTKLCSEMMVDQMKWFIKDFVKTYGAFSRQGVKSYGILGGLYSTGEPKLVGDKQKAKAIMMTVVEQPMIENGTIDLITDLADKKTF